MRKIVAFLVSVLIGLLAWYASLLWQNNQTVEVTDRLSLSASLEKAIDWLEANQADVEKEHNPILWWMLKQSAETASNQRLTAFFQGYKERDLDSQPLNLWSPMFYPSAYVKIPSIEQLDFLPYYNLLFLYGLSCNRELESEPEIHRQLQPGLCSMHFLHPRCVTHQMMGVRFMQRSRCVNSAQLERLVRELQDMVVSEMIWDPRVGDAYIQRVMMLLDSGAADRVKPVWVQRILEAQNTDGGWGDLDPIVKLPGGRVFGFTSLLPSIGMQHSDFHATAQGIWLVSMLLGQ